MTTPMFVPHDEDLSAHQEFLLHLMNQGKDTWNKWVEDNPDEEMNFSGLNLAASEDGICDFEGLKFTKINFRKSTFSGHAYFIEANFSGDAYFTDATFSGHAYFSAATFSGHAYYDEATFSGDAYFTDATFSDDAFFSEATFSRYAYYDEANFSVDAYFNEATFSRYVSFTDATFSRYTYFVKTTFSGDVYFSEATFSDEVDFREATFSESSIFGGSKFKGRSYFDGFSCVGRFDFNYSEFECVPEFSIRSEDDKVKFNFVNANFEYQSSQLQEHGTVRNIQILKSITDATSSVNESRDLFILQRKVERAIAWDQFHKYPASKKLHSNPLVPTFIASIFYGLSNYGRSTLLPLVWLFAFNTGFYFLYKWLLGASVSGNLSALRDYTLSNSLPFGKLLNPAFDNAFEALFEKGDSIPMLFQVASMGQGVINVILLFLIGLSIRNYFKIS